MSLKLCSSQLAAGRVCPGVLSCSNVIWRCFRRACSYLKLNRLSARVCLELYRITSIIRNCFLLGPCSRTTPRALRCSQGGGSFLSARYPCTGCWQRVFGLLSSDHALADRVRIRSCVYWQRVFLKLYWLLTEHVWVGVAARLLHLLHSPYRS